MKLTNLKASHYRSLKDVDVPLGSMNVLIGTNASGKSNVLDALRLLSEGVRTKEFAHAVRTRGDFNQVVWKGGLQNRIELTTIFVDDEGTRYSWIVALSKYLLHGFTLHERMFKLGDDDDSSTQILESRNGKVWWWSTQAKNNRVSLKLSPASCALASACADESFPAHRVAEFVERWGFFDPSPPLLRRAAETTEGDRLDPYGANLAARLYAIKNAPDGDETLNRIVTATRHVLGVPQSIELRVSDSDGRAFFLQKEAGLIQPIHQTGISSGTLRMLAFMTALFGETDTSLVGIEEPENHVHPSALKSLAEYFREASKRVQLIITTHSPILLDCLPNPEEIAIVRRTREGTSITTEENPEGVRKALEESGFSLGEFHESKGFGV
jgi:predicted ATPase